MCACPSSSHPFSHSDVVKEMLHAKDNQLLRRLIDHMPSFFPLSWTLVMDEIRDVELEEEKFDCEGMDLLRLKRILIHRSERLRVKNS